MKDPQPQPLNWFDPEAPRKQLLCKILRMESATCETDLIVTCEIRDGNFTEFVDLMFLEADTKWLKEFFEACEMWIRAEKEFACKRRIGNAKQQTVAPPKPARQLPKKRS